MYRREFVGSLIATATMPSVQSSSPQTANSRVLSLPELGENWSDYEIISSPPDGRYDWDGVFTNRADLSESVSEYASNPPVIASFFAARVDFPDKLRSQEAGSSIDISGGGGIIPVKIRIDRLGELYQSQTCGIDPHPSEVRNFSQSLFLDRVGSQHLIEEDPDIADGLRRDLSLGCANTRNYSKPRYLNYQYTLESTWEAEDTDELEDIDFKGYLSIEYADDEYLLVGGMVPDESVSAELVGENIVSDQASLANSLIRMMEDTSLIA